MRITTLAFLGLSLLAATACRGGGNGDDDDDNPDGPPPGGSVTIQEVQDPAMPDLTPVTLEGVVVTAIDTFGAKTGDMWVEEPGGGAFSGIKVFGAPLDVVATLVPGDIVTLSNAQKKEFACMGDICGGGVFRDGLSITEVQGATGPNTLVVTKTGTGPLPPVETVDAKLIDELPTLAERDAEWEKWEGVLINVINARQLTSVTTFGDDNIDQHAFDASGGIVVESVLADIGAPIAGTCFTGIQGVGDFFFDYLLLPRASTDLVAGGTGCTAQTVATIADVQSGTATGSVVINDVFVTAISFNKKSLWVASSLTAGPNVGLFAFSNGAELDTSVVVGAKVQLLGTAVEFNDDAMGGTLTELTSPAVVVSADAPGTLVPVTNQTVAQLLDPTTAPMFESVLVTLTNVNLTALGNGTNGFIGTAVQNGTSFKFGTEVLRPAVTDLKCYATITGFWTNMQAPATGATTKPNVFGFIPVTLGAAGAACN
jgi:hypothetical protein